MKIKVGDNVRVITGSNKGKEGKVIKTYASKSKVVVEGLNIVKRHSKPRTNEDKGGIFDIEAPIHVSNVKVVENTKTKVKEAKAEEKKPAKKAPAKKTAKKETK